MFAKIYTQIFDSSIAEDYQVRHVFEDLLKLCDRTGIVDMTVEAIARRTNVPLEIVQTAIDKLAKEDPSSRSTAHGGRRIILIDNHRNWGWQIVNYEHYRNLRDEESRKAYFRDAKKRQRGKELSDLPERRESLNGGEPKYHEQTLDILKYLNEKTGKAFRQVDSNLAIISARLKEPGVTAEGVKTMILRQCKRWPEGDRMNEYLRPETLFAKSKFDGYYAAKDMPLNLNENRVQGPEPREMKENIQIKIL